MYRVRNVLAFNWTELKKKEYVLLGWEENILKVLH